MSRHPFRLAVVASAALLAAGCTYVNPITTNETYAASDGLLAEVGDVRGINLLVVTAAGGSAMTGALTNPTGADATVQLTLAGEQTTVTVPAGETVILGFADDHTAVIGGETVIPGLLEAVVLTSGGEELVLAVPVVDGTLPEYRDGVMSLTDYLDALAAAAEPSPSPSASATPVPSPSPSA